MPQMPYVRTGPHSEATAGGHSAAGFPPFPRHVLLIMVDGLGIPAGPVEDSILGDCPALCTLLTSESCPADALLGVPGIPQSATGQTTILTGVNAAQALGAHLSGFPNQPLRDIIRAGNLFSKLAEAGRSSIFANAYARRQERRLPRTLQSVTTVAPRSPR